MNMIDPPFEIRAAIRRDEDELYELAEHLNSVNLPHDRPSIEEILDKSERSFSGEIKDPRRRTYVFVIRDLAQDLAVGTSMVIGQLGSRDAPYIFFDVHDEERYSATLDRHFIHRVLSIGYSYHGPTEIGGLVVHPRYRLTPYRLGMLISYIRFLFIAIHRDDFQNRVLAELMPPLTKDGTSHLWEAVGRRFTGLSYREADLLSKRNKEFIRGLFPAGDIYGSLLPPEAQAVIGEVGPQTKGVAKMLSRIGFRYWNRVDPFDGGPHFIAPTDEIELVQRTRLPNLAENPAEEGKRCLIAREYGASPYFRARVSVFKEGSDPRSEIQIPESIRQDLALNPGDSLALLPLSG